MKISDVVNQMAKVIPQVSDFFTDPVQVAAVSSNGVVTSVQTLTPHDLVDGEFVNVRDIEDENPIASAIFTVENGQSFLEVKTGVDHDLTLHPREKKTKFTKLEGFTDPAWNASLQIVEVCNRRTVKVVNGTASAPVLNSNELLLETIPGRFNGPQTVTVVDPNNFTYPSSNTSNGRGGKVGTKVRIAGVVDFERALDQYSRKKEDDFFMFVVSPQSVAANKSRGSETDINDEQTLQTNLNQNIRDGFIVLVLANASSEAGALKSMDNIRDTVFRQILLAVRGVKFPSGLECEPNQIANFISHGKLLYNGAQYVHQFIFEQPLVLTVGDSVQPETRAFRDIDFVSSTKDNADAPDLTASINLDDKPLP